MPAIIQKILKKELAPLFSNVANLLFTDKSITDKNLDGKALTLLIKKVIRKKNLKIYFSTPNDNKYKAEAGRTPYDILSYGEINKTPFKIFINNKLGNIAAGNKNDITTYSNLLRLYLNTSDQRLTDKLEIDKKTIYKRIAGKEFVLYGVFVIDKNLKQNRFFFLEDIKDKFYINPRNTMFQIEYDPDIRIKPLDFYSFTLFLIDSAIIALNKTINKAKTEIVILQQIKLLMNKLKKNV